MSKIEIIALLKSSNLKNAEIFKSKKETDFSLTEIGYKLLVASKLFPTQHIAKLEQDFILAPSTLIALKQIFDTPYFIRGCSVYYFDEIVHTQICIHGSLTEYIAHQKSVDKFNKK